MEMENELTDRDRSELLDLIFTPLYEALTCTARDKETFEDTAEKAKLAVKGALEGVKTLEQLKELWPKAYAAFTTSPSIYN